MISVVVSNVTFDPKSRRCLNCKMFYDVNSGKCPRCERPYECLEPCWDARLRLAESETDSVYRGFMNVVRLSGPAMDVIMGMTVVDYLRLCERFGDMSPFVERFFCGNSFMMRRTVDKVLSISLTSGNQLNFRNWLGLQPGFDLNAITETLMSEEVVEIDSGDEVDLMDELAQAEEMREFLRKNEDKSVD